MSVDLQPSGRAHDIRRRGNNLGERAFIALSIVAIAVPLLILGGLVVNTLGDAIGRLDWDFLSSYPSRRASAAGILPALIGSLWLIALTALIALPLGVGAALWLEEYGGKSRLAAFIEVNIANLAGVPSIIYGLLGLGLFVRFLGLGRSVLAGALTLSLLVMPIVIIATREALRTVPGHLREAASALGATRWQVIRQVILPMSLPGIMTGAILSISRAIGETAPLIVVGALTYVTFLPADPGDPFTALPIQIYNWVSRPQEAFLVNAAAGIMVLLVTMLVLNSVAVLLRNRLQKRTR